MRKIRLQLNGIFYFTIFDLFEYNRSINMTPLKLCTFCVIITLMFAATSHAAIYYLEAENYVDSLGGPVQYDENDGGLGGITAMSGDTYVQENTGTYLLFHVPEGALPAGTYTIAERGYSNISQSRGVGIQMASGFTDIFTGFVAIGSTLNSNNSNVAVEWKPFYTDNSGSTVATIVIPDGDFSLRISVDGSSTAYSDVFAFSTLDESELPSNTVPGGDEYTPQILIPEPGTLAILGVGLTLMCSRKREAS